MLPLRLRQGISSGRHHATLKPKKLFWENCHYCGKGALGFCFDLARVLLQGASMLTQHIRIYFLDLSLLWEGDRYITGALCLCYDLLRLFSGFNHDKPTH